MCSRAAADAPCLRAATSRVRAREFASARARHARFSAARPVSPPRARTFLSDVRWRLCVPACFAGRRVTRCEMRNRFSPTPPTPTLTSATFLRSIR